MTAYEKYLERRGVLGGVQALAGCSGIVVSVSIPEGCNQEVKDAFVSTVRDSGVQRRILGLIAQEAGSEIERHRQAARLELAEVMKEKP